MKALIGTESIKLNAFANYVGFFYTAIIGIAVLPLYLGYLGAEAFGLVGFFIVLQSWLQFLNIGMSPMLSRMAAITRGQGGSSADLKKLLRSLEIIVFFISSIAVVSIFIARDWISVNWLNVDSLPVSKVAACIVLMGVTIGLRLFVMLYQSGIRGMERQVVLNVAVIVMVTLKFVGALLLLQYVTREILDYFLYQFLVGIIELVVLASMFYQILPSEEKVNLRFYWNTVKPMLPFAAGVAYTAMIWIVITQADKLILSNVLPLTEYGYFALVIIVANGINQISRPITQAILPRMTYLVSRSDDSAMLTLYRNSTQIMAVIVLSVSGMIAFFATELLFAWTGDRKAAEWAGPILFWFALGNGILAISAFQYYLQFAYGKVKMHVIYNTVLVCVQVPLIVYMAYEYGVLGVALTWFCVRLIVLIIWTPIVHSKLAPGIHWQWLLKDIAPVLGSTLAVFLLVSALNIGFTEMKRFDVFILLIGIGLVLLAVNSLVSSVSRNFLVAFLKKGFLLNAK